MSVLGLLTFLLSISAATCNNYTFIRFSCTKLMASEYSSTVYKDLTSAYSRCVTGRSTCIGVRQYSENLFIILAGYFTNGIDDDWCGDLILDRSNGSILANAPSFKDTMMLYGIYNYHLGSDPMCPYVMYNKNGRCEGTGPGEERCKLYPSYMDAKYDPITGICSVKTLKDIETMWT